MTKTLRFKLNYVEGKKLEIPDQTRKLDFQNLISVYKDILRSFENIIYTTKNDGSQFLNKKIKIKFPWLKTYLKNEFFELKDKLQQEEKNIPRQYEIGKFIQPIEDWIEENIKTIQELETLENAPEEKKFRRREFAYYIRKLRGRTGFEFIKELFNENIAKASIEDRKLNKINSLIKDFAELIILAEKEFLPSQSSGLKVAGASFNFSTVNKQEKSYFERQVKREEESLKERVPNKLFNFIDYNKSTNQKEVIFTLNEDVCKTIGLKEDIFTKSIDEVYSIIKLFKASAKSEFLEAVSQDKVYFENLATNYPLFVATRENFDNFIKLSRKIEENNNKKNELLKQGKSKNNPEILNIDRNTETLAQNRGEFFNAPKRSVQTKNYYYLCEVYRQIALHRGQIYSRIKGNQTEKVNAVSLNYWSLIWENNNKHFLVLVPRNTMSKAKEFVDILDKNKPGNPKLHYFQSVTLRALEKLCFKEFGNTFLPNDRTEFNKIDFSIKGSSDRLNFDEVKEVKEIHKKNKYKDLEFIEKEKDESLKKTYVNEVELINFYKKVLSTDYAKREIIKSTELYHLLKNDHNKMSDFESDLEKVCYKKSVIVDEAVKDTLLNQYQATIFEITSQDLRLDNQGRKIRKHTEFWNNFWSIENKKDFYTTRLNPQISISWRETDQEWQENIRSGNWQVPVPQKLKKFRNRKLEPQFTLSTTLTLNATSKKMDLGFNQSIDIRDKILEFNNYFNTEIAQNYPYYYGIDRGLKELATLCIVKFSDEKNRFGKPKPQEFANINSKIDVWELKKEYYFEELRNENNEIVRNMKGQPIVAIKNISRFMNRLELFEKFENQEISCLDLTCAKMINGKIVLNGDLMTYLKLKELAAKRKIKEFFELGLLNNQVEFKGTKVLQINGENVYWLLDTQKEQKVSKYKQLPLKDQIIEDLRNYVEKLKENNEKERILGISDRTRDVLEIEQIDHLRDAITANIIGIVSHLQKHFPGIISLENMTPKEHIDPQFLQSNENISRRLEWSLYRKFALQSLVPPKIQQSVFIRGELGINQFGIINFSNILDSSSGCPICENNYSEDKKEEYRKNKTSGLYICNKPNCGFNSKDNRLELEPLDSSDKVAAYNIAKNAIKILCLRK